MINTNYFIKLTKIENCQRIKNRKHRIEIYLRYYNNFRNNFWMELEFPKFLICIYDFHTKKKKIRKIRN